MNIQPASNVKLAYERITPYLQKTPLLRSSYLNEALGHDIVFKAESLQKTGSFKVRGALNAILALKEKNQLPEKISTYSTGNHGLALAWICKLFNIKLNLYLPANTSKTKQLIAASHGANVILTKTRSEAEASSLNDASNNGYMLLPPSDNDDVIAGAGTACYEALLEEQDFDAVFAPCGGGGLISGSYLATNLLSPSTKVFAGEPKQANDAAISYRTGKIFRFTESPQTLADGTRTLGIVPRIFEYIKLIDGFFEITEREIAYWTIWINHLLKIHSEFSSSLATAAGHRWLNKQKTPKKILIILTGGNIDGELKQSIWQDNCLHLQPFDFHYDEE